jgi:hypothetical protein
MAARLTRRKVRYGLERDVHIKFRVSPSERALLERRVAASDARDLSHYCRHQLMIDKLKPAAPRFKDAMDAVCAMLGTAQQIKAALPEGQDTERWDHFHEVGIRALEKLLDAAGA